jgi:hypothetical protein
MEVAIVNDGPVTIILDSVQRDPADVAAGGGAGGPTKAQSAAVNKTDLAGGQSVVHETGQAKSKAGEQVKGKVKVKGKAKVKVNGVGEGGERAEQHP